MAPSSGSLSVHDGVVLDIADDASRADQVDFIDAYPLGGLKPELGLQLVHIVPEDVADGFFVQAGFIGQTGESA